MQRLKADVKQRIMEVGMRRFKKEGFENTSMNDIASDAGISTGNIYRYFLTKKHLLNEILVETEDEIKHFFDKIPSNYEKIKLNDLFEMITDFTLKIAKEKNDTLKIMLNSQNESQFMAFKEHILSVFAQKIITIVKSISSKKEYVNLCEAIARANFEGYTYIVKNNLDDITSMKQNLELYKKLMIEDLGNKVMEVIKK